MYENEQSRINAIISYFFLGPIFLLAKAGTPLGERYVRSHAKRSSMIILSMILALIVYIIFRPYIVWTLPGIGIDLRSIILIVIMGVTLCLLMRGAYRAYHGDTGGALGGAEDIALLGVTRGVGSETIETEEVRVRILMSLVPLLGFYIAERYAHPLMTRGRIIGSFFLFLYSISLLFSSERGFLPFIILIFGIFVFVLEGVYLILYHRWIALPLLERLPSYREIEAALFAFFGEIDEFFSLAFGKGRVMTFGERYIRERDGSISPEFSDRYFMPPGLLAIPFWNLFGIPSLFLEKYSAYRVIISDGLIITGILIYFWFYLGMWTSPWLLLLLFPIAHIAVYAGTPSYQRVPGIGLISHFFGHLINREKKEIPEKKETFTYDVDKKFENL